VIDPAHLALAVLESLLVVYGVTESKLMGPVRVGWEYAAIKRGAWLFQGFLHCPFCVGFWVALALGLLRGSTPETLLVTPAILIALLAGRRDLIRPPYDAERKAAEDLANQGETETPP